MFSFLDFLFLSLRLPIFPPCDQLFRIRTEILDPLPPPLKAPSSRSFRLYCLFFLDLVLSHYPTPTLTRPSLVPFLRFPFSKPRRILGSCQRIFLVLSCTREPLRFMTSPPLFPIFSLAVFFSLSPFPWSKNKESSLPLAPYQSVPPPRDMLFVMISLKIFALRPPPIDQCPLLHPLTS